MQFQGNLLVSLKLTERATGHVLYENPALQESTDFGAVSGTVVTGVAALPGRRPSTRAISST